LHKKSKHEGIGHPCDRCDYIASKPSHLKRHQESKHNGVTYPCDQCNYIATRKDYLKLHKRSEHGELSAKEIAQRKRQQAAESPAETVENLLKKEESTDLNQHQSYAFLSSSFPSNQSVRPELSSTRPPSLASYLPNHLTNSIPKSLINSLHHPSLPNPLHSSSQSVNHPSSNLQQSNPFIQTSLNIHTSHYLQ